MFINNNNYSDHVFSLNFSPVPVAPPAINMQAPTRVILVNNESLTLTCNTTNVNGEIKLKWVKPLGSVRLLCSYAVPCAVLYFLTRLKSSALIKTPLRINYQP